MKRTALLLALLALAACGRQTQLRPKAGDALPPKPAMAAGAPTVDQLLAPYAGQRIDKMVRRSRERAEDPFDLPPGR